MSDSVIVRSLTRRDSGGEARFSIPSEQILRTSERRETSPQQKPLESIFEPGLIAGGGPLAVHNKKPIVVCSRHGPQDIQRLLRGVALAKYSSAVPRVCQRPLAAESPLLSFLPQGQKVFVRTAGASCD